MLCFSGARPLVLAFDITGWEKSGFLGSVYGMINTRSHIVNISPMKIYICFNIDCFDVICVRFMQTVTACN